MTADTMREWESRLRALLPLYGHRNWIVVADSAYPAQSRQGIETIVAEAEQIAVVSAVHDAIKASRHARAIVHVDAELGFVEEKDAPGVSDYRKELDKVFVGAHVNRVLHEQVIHKLDQSAQVFRILP